MIKVVFFGTPKIAEKSLEYLAGCENIEVVAVVTQQDKPSGRGKKLTPPPIKVLAESLGIPVFQPYSIRKEPEIQEALKKLSPDFFITFAFGQILSQEVLDIPKFATINMHASLLPAYRGANPIQRSIYNGDKETGITTMITVLELDAGDICEQECIEITDTMTDIELAEIISEKAPKILESSIMGMFDGTLKPVAQNSDEVTFANKFSKEDGLIDFSKPAKDIVNQVRSMVSWPNAYTSFNGKTIKVLEAVVSDVASSGEFGSVYAVDKFGIWVNARDYVLIIKSVKPEGKGVMPAAAWSNGSGIKKGEVLGA